MAKQSVKIAGFGPFIYDDTTDKAVETEGEVDGDFTQGNVLEKLQGDLDISTISKDVDVAELIITFDFG